MCHGCLEGWPQYGEGCGRWRSLLFIICVNRAAIKRCWLHAHVWLGLGLGLFFVFEGLTGSVLVFHRAIDTWLNSVRPMAVEPKNALPLDDLLASLRAATPDLPAPTYLDLPQTKTDVVHAWYRMREESRQAERKLEILLDPATGVVLGRREYGTHAMSIIYGLHREWLSGNSGETVVGGVGIGLVFSVITGVYIWWPKPGHFLKTVTTCRTCSGRQRYAYLHKTVGIGGAVMLILVACSGIFIEFHEWLTPAIGLLSPVAEGEPEVSSYSDGGVAPISMDYALSVARQRFPDAEVKYVMLPYGPTGVYLVGLRQPEEVLKTSGSSGVWIDQYSGDILAVRDWTQFTAGETVVAWMFPLHNGEAFGLIARWIVFVTGFLPVVLYVTALHMWWVKRQAHRRQSMKNMANFPSHTAP